MSMNMLDRVTIFQFKLPTIYWNSFSWSYFLLLTLFSKHLFCDILSKVIAHRQVKSWSLLWAHPYKNKKVKCKGRKHDWESSSDEGVFLVGWSCSVYQTNLPFNNLVFKIMLQYFVFRSNRRRHRIGTQNENMWNAVTKNNKFLVLLMNHLPLLAHMRTWTSNQSSWNAVTICLNDF